MAELALDYQVYADIVSQKLGLALRTSQVAFDATSAVGDISNFGSTVVFPYIKNEGDAVEIARGGNVVPADMDMDSLEAKIKLAAWSKRIYDKDIATIKGSAIDRLAEIAASRMAAKIDGDLVTAMDTDAVYKVATANGLAITEDEILEGMSMFGDNQDTATYAGIIANSAMQKSFYSMPHFTDITKTFNQGAGANNGFVMNGVIGFLYNVPVILTDNLTKEGTGATAEAKTYIVKRDSLGIVWQRNVKVVPEREEKYFATDLVASAMYATRLLDDSGVVLLRKTV